MGCSNTRLDQQQRNANAKTVVAIESMTEVSEMGDILKQINRNPTQYFVNQNIKGCFRKPNKERIGRSKSTVTETTS